MATHKMAAALLLLLLATAGAAYAQGGGAGAGCRTYKRFGAVGGAPVLMDSIEVPDAFTVGTASVSGINLAHPSIGKLQLTLLHRQPTATANSAVVLKRAGAGADGANLASVSFADSASAEFPTSAVGGPIIGAFKPAQPLSAFAGQAAAGPWVLRAVDLGEGAADRPLTLAGWSLTLCPSASAAAGPADGMPPPPPPGNVSVALNGSGLEVNVSGNGTGFRLGLGGGNGLNITSYSGPANSLVSLLFPFSAAGAAKSSIQPGPIAGAVVGAKQAVREAVAAHVDDGITFAVKQSGLIKELINAKLGRLINTINAASAGTQGLLKSGGADLKGHAASLAGRLLTLQGKVDAMHGLGAAAKQDLTNHIEATKALLAKFVTLGSAVAGDMGVSVGSLKDAATAKAKGIFDAWTTAEGLAKTHVDNVLASHAAVLDGLLDKIIAGLDAASTVTGPVLDVKLSAHKAKLQLLSAALDKVVAGIKALPTASQALKSHTDKSVQLLGATRVGKAISQPEVALSNLLGKVGQAQQMIKTKLGN